MSRGSTASRMSACPCRSACVQTDRQTHVLPGPLSVRVRGAMPDAVGSSVGVVTSWRSAGEKVCAHRGTTMGEPLSETPVARANLAARGGRTGQSCRELEVGAVRSVGLSGRQGTLGGHRFLLWPPHEPSLRARFLLSPTSRLRVGVRPEAGGLPKGSAGTDPVLPSASFPKSTSVGVF